ncbi:unnamed protein product [Diplocarpon coronariae]|nr:hypothetical protein JHW43_000352 [Diplocarpon mali]
MGGNVTQQTTDNADRPHNWLAQTEELQLQSGVAHNAEAMYSQRCGIVDAAAGCPARHLDSLGPSWRSSRPDKGADHEKMHVEGNHRAGNHVGVTLPARLSKKTPRMAADLHSAAQKKATGQRCKQDSSHGRHPCSSSGFSSAIKTLDQHSSNFILSLGLASLVCGGDRRAGKGGQHRSRGWTHLYLVHSGLAWTTRAITCWVRRASSRRSACSMPRKDLSEGAGSGTWGSATLEYIRAHVLDRLHGQKAVRRGSQHDVLRAHVSLAPPWSRNISTLYRQHPSFLYLQEAEIPTSDSILLLLSSALSARNIMLSQERATRSGAPVISFSVAGQGNPCSSKRTVISVLRIVRELGVMECGELQQGFQVNFRLAEDGFGASLGGDGKERLAAW